MKTTGVIRRIDELGRIVIPKEIRKSLRIKNGESLEVYLDGDSIILKKFIKKEDVVISTGGGIITTKENYNILKNEENVIFLDASVETIISHLQNERNKRPLLKESENLNKKIEELLSTRYEKYRNVSDILIDINGKNIDEVISQILVYI